MDEIFGDSDVQRAFEVVDRERVSPRFDDLTDHDRELFMQFLRADQDPEKLATPAMLIKACAAGVKAFEQLADPMPRSWAAGWKKFILYITSFNTQTLWDRFLKDKGQSHEVAIFADWVVFSIESRGWGPDGLSTPLGRQHSYCMAVAAEAGGGIKINPSTGYAEAPDGSAARNYDPAAGPVPAPARQAPQERQAPPARAAAKPAAAGGYAKFFLDAGISRDQEVYRRCLDAVLAKEGIKAEDIVGLGEKGLASKSLYVVHRQAVTFAEERGVFSKRVDVQRLCPITSIARLGTTEEGFRPRQLTITAHDAAGAEVLKIAWAEGFEDQEKRRVLRQREHLVKVISAALDQAGRSPVQASVSAPPSKAAALREWAAGVVQDAGVSLTAERVEEHANMAAGGIRFMVFLQLGAPLGISDLQQFYYPDPMPELTPIAGFDDLYRRVIARVGGAELVDQGIDDVLASNRPEFVRGCRERYS